MKKRIISAIIASLIMAPIVIYGSNIFYITVCILGAIGLNEILTIRGTRKKIPNTMRVLATISYVLIAVGSCNLFEFNINTNYLIIPYLICFIPILFYDKKYTAEDAFFVIGTIMFLGLAFNHIIVVRDLSLYKLLYIVVIATMNDTFAHLFGVQIGRYKLCSEISPNKTVEGFIGGSLMATILGTMFYITFISNPPSLIFVIVMSFALSLVATFGDLVFSKIKRLYSVKDFGSIMPGHGGVLDRLDSFLLCIIVYSIFLSLL